MITINLTGADPEMLAERLGVEIPAALSRAVLRAGQEAEGELTEAVMETLTKRPTGTLARSFRTQFLDGKEPRAIAASELPYAAIHDRGGTITAKRAKYLAIPQSGIPRGMGPRQYGAPLHFRPSKKGGGVLVDDGGRVRFVLKRSVTIQGTGYVAIAKDRLEEALPGIVDEELQAGVDKAETEAGD